MDTNMQHYTLQISALSEIPFSESNASLPDCGSALIRSQEGIITGVIVDITSSALADCPLDYLSALHKCIFEPEHKSVICLDNEGQDVDIHFTLNQDGSIACSVDLTDLNPVLFVDGAYVYRGQKKDVYNKIDDKKISNYTLRKCLTFQSPAANWCKSMIALAKSENEHYELFDQGAHYIYDASPYVRDLEEFQSRINNNVDGKSATEIASTIEFTKAPSIIRPGPNGTGAE